MVARPLTGLAVASSLVAVALVPAVAPAQNRPATGTVLSSDRTTVNARVSPGGATGAKVRHGSRLRITCQMSGPVASGRGGRSTIWNRVIVGSARLYVADTQMRSGPSGVLVAKLCGAPALDPQRAPGDTKGACGITSPVAQLPPFPSRRAFIAAAVPGAQRSDRATRVPASVTLAQSILETASGTIAAGANNYFGIKASAVADRPGVFEWGVNGAGCVLRKTEEVVGRRFVMTIGAFRAYRTLNASIEDHGARLLGNPVYQGAFRYTEKPESFARVIARYYATDPGYARKVISLMRSEKLTRYDVESGSAAPAAPAAGPTASTAPAGDGGVSPSR